MLPKHLAELTWYAPHQAWLQKNGYYTAHVVPDDIEPSRANLCGANLDGANLCGANLYGASLDGASLVRANLYGANLDRANLVRASLDRANLVRASLYGANLVRASLDGASLDGANLDGANLTRANLVRASLDRASLDGANLYGANLTRANLCGASLVRANLDRAKNIETARIAPFAIVPEVGMFTAFKKVNCGSGSAILELLVPADAKRINTPVGRKCRVSAARVIDAKAVDGSAITDTVFYSSHDPKFTYQVGTLAEVADFDDDIRIECTRGIHCFITRREAAEY